MTKSKGGYIHLPPNEAAGTIEGTVSEDTVDTGDTGEGITPITDDHIDATPVAVPDLPLDVSITLNPLGDPNSPSIGVSISNTSIKSTASYEDNEMPLTVSRLIDKPSDEYLAEVDKNNILRITLIKIHSSLISLHKRLPFKRDRDSAMTLIREVEQVLNGS